MTTFNLPLEVQVSAKKKFILNLNNYRNTHFHVLNKSKVVYTEQVKSILASISNNRYDKIALSYTLYPKDRRRKDVSNICSIVDKYFSDALVEMGIIPDDDYEHVIGVQYLFGSIDKDNPRVEVEIIPIEEE